VQQRIDLGETTLELVLDEEPEKVDTLAERNGMQRDLAKRPEELRMMAAIGARHRYKPHGASEPCCVS
jgi:hypothetical protein